MSEVQQAGDGERVVAHELGLEPARILRGEQPVVRDRSRAVPGAGCGSAGRWRSSPSAGPCASRPSRSRGTRPRASRAARDGTAVRPARRGRRHGAEAVAEELLPQPVHDDARGERFSGETSQFGEIEPGEPLFRRALAPSRAGSAASRAARSGRSRPASCRAAGRARSSGSVGCVMSDHASGRRASRELALSSAACAAVKGRPDRLPC